MHDADHASSDQRSDTKPDRITHPYPGRQPDGDRFADAARQPKSDANRDAAGHRLGRPQRYSDILTQRSQRCPRG